MFRQWKGFWIGFAALALGIVSPSVSAHCDKITGGGWIVVTSQPIPHPPAKGTFGAAGGCKHGQPWGHLEYHDHGNGLNVHWLTITGYVLFSNDTPDENDPKREGSRFVCGTARTNLFDEVDFVFFASDRGEPGVDDQFVLRLRKAGATVYTTEFDADSTLGGGGRGGGNFNLHKPNPSTSQQLQSCTCAALPEFAAFCSP